MASFKTLADRQADRAKAQEKLAERARQFVVRSIGSKARPENPPPVAAAASPLPAPSVHPSTPTRPWLQARSGSAPVEYLTRSTNQQIRHQPWTTGLVNALLEAAADSGGVHICLVWPARLDGLPLIHALANIERTFATDLRGLRTLLFPATHASRAALQGTLANKEQLSDFYRSLWALQPDGSMEVSAGTASPSHVAVLSALNDIRNWHPELANPSLAELVPTFVFDASKKGWTSMVQSPLERTLCKVEKLANRKSLREKVNIEWGNVAKAPGALMVLHHTTRKDAWKEALGSSALKGGGRPEVFLMDATTAAARTNYNAVKRIPDFLRCAQENGFGGTGVVVVTDDPKTFFVLRAQVYELKLALTTRIWAAEAEDVFLSPQPVSADWKPEQRSNSNFSVGIVDRDASQVALAFQRLAQAAGNEDSPPYQALMAACLYVLRLSNMPAGYSDLTLHTAESVQLDFAGQRNAWTPVKLGVVSVLSSGTLNSLRTEVDTAIRKAEKLIDDWSDATPMASRLMSEVQKHATAGKLGLVIVLPNSKYVLLAHRFLQRKLCDKWAAMEEKLEWHTLSSVGKTLSGERKGKHFIFVSVNPDVLRVLVSHPDIPHGTAVLIAYKQAETTLKTLTSMKEFEAFKPYRGRIGLLAQELERRLKEVPNPLVISRLSEMSMTFKLDESGHQNSGAEQAYFKYDLEGGGRAYATGWVYRYEQDEDPFFRRTAASNVQVGDSIFDMSEELRTQLEASLQLNGAGTNSMVDPVRMLMKLYHRDVQTRCQLLFKATKRSALAREIHAKMLALDSKATDCGTGRVYYWLELQAEGDTRPHASKDAVFFKLFCKALEFNDEAADQNWKLIRNARRLNQYLGRELVARYAEILFQPESAAAYRKVPEAIIKRLQQAALACVYRVERVTMPTTRASA